METAGFLHSFLDELTAAFSSPTGQKREEQVLSFWWPTGCVRLRDGNCIVPVAAYVRSLHLLYVSASVCKQPPNPCGVLIPDE